MQVERGCLRLLLLLLKKGGMRWEAGRPHKHRHKTIAAPRRTGGRWRLLHSLLKQNPSAGWCWVMSIRECWGAGAAAAAAPSPSLLLPLVAAAGGCGGS